MKKLFAGVRKGSTTANEEEKTKERVLSMIFPDDSDDEDFESFSASEILPHASLILIYPSTFTIECEPSGLGIRLRETLDHVE